jgi:hypothetical protein
MYFPGPGPQLATSAAVKRMCASVQTILDICKQETLVSTLSTCEETLRAILHTLKVYIFNVYKYVVAQKSSLKCNTDKTGPGLIEGQRCLSLRTPK